VLSAVAARGGSVERATIEDGDCHMTVHLPHGVDVRTVTDAVTAAYPAAELVTRRQVSRDADENLRDVLVEELTDRQRAALEAAYHAGYFAWPRDANGTDVAGSLGVTSPAFHQHLREAEKHVFGALLSASAPA